MTRVTELLIEALYRVGEWCMRQALAAQIRRAAEKAREERARRKHPPLRVAVSEPVKPAERKVWN